MGYDMWWYRGTDSADNIKLMVAEGVEETAADPAIAGEVVVEAADSTGSTDEKGSAALEE